MAEFRFDYYVVFNPGDTTPSNVGAGGPATGTLDDGDADLPGSGVFEEYEPVTYTFDTNGLSETLTARGTVDIDGVTFVVFSKNATQWYAFGYTGDPSNFGPVTFVDPSDFSAGGFPVCFAPGTLIATPEGETTVETLRIGDMVRTVDGRAVPVKWIGRQTLHKFFAGERARPVRVAEGALGNGLPHSDLVLTTDHALILDGLAINAGALVNGTTITLEPLAALPDRVTYYHIETEAHDVILANGAAAETYVDYRGRAAFDNHAEYLDLYGNERIITEMAYPRISSARQLPPGLRNRVAGGVAA